MDTEIKNKEVSRTRERWEEVPEIYSSNFDFKLGPITFESLVKDPKHLGFTLSRYKFAAKMMKDCKRILEVGCGEGIGAFVFLSETNAEVISADFDESQIEYTKKNILPYSQGRVNFICQDFVTEPYKEKKADGIVCIDVIEHIHPDEESQFLENYSNALMDKGISIIGTPNKYAAQYGSQRSKAGHINLFDAERLRSTLSKYFTHTFIFSMNDEVVHTGYDKMAHYLIALSIK